MVINEAVKRNVEISSRQGSSVSTTEPDDEDKKNSKQNSYHLWIMTQITFTMLHMCFIYMYKI